jgi:putative transposase
MLNHIHLIIDSPDVAGFLRDFKRSSSSLIRKNIQLTEPNLLKLLINKSSPEDFNLWDKINMPVNITTQKFFL